jgi:hypothetical protein
MPHVIIHLQNLNNDTRQAINTALGAYNQGGYARIEVERMPPFTLQLAENQAAAADADLHLHVYHEPVNNMLANQPGATHTTAASLLAIINRGPLELMLYLHQQGQHNLDANPLVQAMAGLNLNG